jgi:predicted small lipoprotein YifL
MKTRFVVILLIIAIFVIACGRKEKPLPPEAKAPRAVSYFTARGDVQGIILSWTAPEKTAQGELLKDLSSFLIMRARHTPDEIDGPDTLAQIRHTPEVGSQEPKKYFYRDENVRPGQKMSYVVYPVNEQGVRGVPSPSLLVTFRGSSSIIQQQ